MTARASASEITAAQVQLEFSKSGWLFHPLAADFGIDAQAESVGHGSPSCRLIALVLNAGDAFFSETRADGWLFRDSSAQLLYWLGSSLPVILLLHRPVAGITYWVHITQHAVEYTSEGWKILIPSSQVLGPEALRAFAALTDPSASRDIRADVRWLRAGKAVAHSAAATAESVGQPAQESFVSWVGTLVDRFQHAVEDNDLWLALWDNQLTRPRGEKVVQAIAAAMWPSLCEFADIDMTRDANAGRGAVDFKFSAGWQRRALIEVKLLASSKLGQDTQAQLPQYLASERVSYAYYVCVDFTNNDLRQDRLDFVRGICSARGARSGLHVSPRFIDARPKEPASRLRG